MIGIIITIYRAETIGIKMQIWPEQVDLHARITLAIVTSVICPLHPTGIAEDVPTLKPWISHLVWCTSICYSIFKVNDCLSLFFFCVDTENSPNPPIVYAWARQSDEKTRRSDKRRLELSVNTVSSRCQRYADHLWQDGSWSTAKKQLRCINVVDSLHLFFISSASQKKWTDTFPGNVSLTQKKDSSIGWAQHISSMWPGMNPSTPHIDHVWRATNRMLHSRSEMSWRSPHDGRITSLNLHQTSDSGTGSALS